LDKDWLKRIWKLASLVATIVFGTDASKIGSLRFVPLIIFASYLIANAVYHRSSRLQALVSRLRRQASLPEESRPAATAALGFRGLLPFREEDEKSFSLLGREPVIAALLPSLREPNLPLLVLRGAPGSGKTSLIRAGLVPPLLAQKWQVLYVESTAPASVDAVRVALSNAQVPVLIVVDQFEEHFLRGAPQEFVTFLLGSLAARSARWLLSVREDFPIS